MAATAEKSRIEKEETPALGPSPRKSEAPKPLMRFRLNRGGHSEQRWVLASTEDVEADLPGIVKRPDGKHYRLVKKDYTAGDEIETDRDLVALFNAAGPDQKKFTRLEEGQGVSSASPYPNPWENLEDMSIDQLKGFALSQEIEIKGAKTKEEIITALLDAVT